MRRYNLAGKSIAVPFVGATAASLVVAEAIRIFHSGPAYTDIKLSLTTLGNARPTHLGKLQRPRFGGLQVLRNAVTRAVRFRPAFLAFPSILGLRRVP